MLIIFTGNGKGKTTAAIGQAMRAVGNGSSILVVQLVKGPWQSGEDVSLKAFYPRLKIVKKGRGFVKIGNDKLPFEEHVKAAQKGLAYALSELVREKRNILIVDEIWTALGLGLLNPEGVDIFIKNVRPLCDHVIMTGRGCPQRFIDEADLVTEMREIKHPFSKGAEAVCGIEY